MADEVKLKRVEASDCALLRHLQAEAGRGHAMVGAARLVTTLIYEKYGFADNVQVNLQTGDATVRETKPGVAKVATPISEGVAPGQGNP